VKTFIKSILYFEKSEKLKLKTDYKKRVD
jgi:hypothetical protein